MAVEERSLSRTPQPRQVPEATRNTPPPYSVPRDEETVLLTYNHTTTEKFQKVTRANIFTVLPESTREHVRKKEITRDLRARRSAQTISEIANNAVHCFPGASVGRRRDKAASENPAKTDPCNVRTTGGAHKESKVKKNPVNYPFRVD